MPDPEPEAPSAASPDASTPSSPSSTSSPVRSTDQSSSTGLEPGSDLTSDLTSDRVVLDAEDISRALTRMAHQILETNRGPEGLVLAGIPSRGVPLAERLARAIAASEGIEIPTGALDITMYRDDLRQHPTRMVGHTHLPAGIDGAVVVLVDDVLFSGRTVRAALDALGDLGRPRAVRLAVLVDRGHRQLPIRADHVGKNLPTADEERVLVRLEETDGVNEVRILRPPPEAPAPTATGSSTRGGL